MISWRGFSGSDNRGNEETPSLGSIFSVSLLYSGGVVQRQVLFCAFRLVEFYDRIILSFEGKTKCGGLAEAHIKTLLMSAADLML